MTRQILLVDDSVDDMELVQRSLKKLAPQVQQFCARDGVEALALLHAKEGERLVPDVVLLDLKMPRLDGTDVLRALRAESTTRFIPVVMFSSSNQRSDTQKCYELGASSYLRKPVSFSEYEGTLRCVVDYWLELNLLPR